MHNIYETNQNWIKIDHLNYKAYNVLYYTSNSLLCFAMMTVHSSFPILILH